MSEGLIRIEGGPNAHDCRVIVNGREIRGVRGFVITGHVKDQPRVRAQLDCLVEMDVIGELPIEGEPTGPLPPGEVPIKGEGALFPEPQMDLTLNAKLTPEEYDAIVPRKRMRGPRWLPWGRS